MRWRFHELVRACARPGPAPSNLKHSLRCDRAQLNGLMNKKKSINLIVSSILTLSLVTVAPVSAAVVDGVNYLRGTQDANGLVEGDVRSTDWAVIGVSAVGTNPATVGSLSLVTAMSANSPGSAATDVERRILALRAAGLDAGAETNRLLEHSSNHQLGSSELLNDDTFGVLALRAAGSGSSIIADSVAFIQTHQNSDGGFSSLVGGGSDVDSTGAALAALAAGGGATDVINRGFDYLTAQQNSDGGFGVKAGSSSNVDSTSWALWAYHTAGRSNSAAQSWLMGRQQGNGSYGGAVSTAYALIALGDRALPIVGNFTSPPTPAPVPSPIPMPRPLPEPLPADQPQPAPGSANRLSSVSTAVSVSVAGSASSASGSASVAGDGTSQAANARASSIVSAPQLARIDLVAPALSTHRTNAVAVHQSSDSSNPTAAITTSEVRARPVDQPFEASPNLVVAQSPGRIDPVAARTSVPSQPSRLIRRLVLALLLMGVADLVAIGAGIGQWLHRRHDLGRTDRF